MAAWSVLTSSPGSGTLLARVRAAQIRGIRSCGRRAVLAGRAGGGSSVRVGSDAWLRRGRRERRADGATRAPRTDAGAARWLGARGRGVSGLRPTVGRFAPDPSRAGPPSRGCGGLRPTVGRFAHDPSRAGPRSPGVWWIASHSGTLRARPLSGRPSEPGVMRIASHIGTLRAAETSPRLAAGNGCVMRSRRVVAGISTLPDQPAAAPATDGRTGATPPARAPICAKSDALDRPGRSVDPATEQQPAPDAARRSRFSSRCDSAVLEPSATGAAPDPRPSRVNRAARPVRR